MEGSGSTRFSVVVPTWEERAALPRLVESLAAQELAHELVVSDGGSTDGTPELAAALGARVVSGPRGRGGQLARGAAASTGELLLFLHADARLAPGALRALAVAFEDERVVATGMRQSIEHAARFYRLVERAADRRVRRGWVYGDSGLCVRRSAYAASGGYRDLPVFEDLDLSRRIRALGRIRLVEDAHLSCSARRWEREGRVRRTLANWVLTALWAAGVDPVRLARFYVPEGSARAARGDG